MKARKRFGQHFLERAWVDKLVARIAPAADQAFIEIGPGRGALTLPLAASGAAIRAIEVDRDLAAALEAHALPNVTVVEADFLELSTAAIFGDTSELASDAAASADAATARARRDGDADAPARGASARVRIVGNLPYNISSPILFRLLAVARETSRLVDATLMLQREVAIRIAAGPGSGDYGPLGILTAVHADVDRLLELPPGAFRPAPKVHSSVIRLRFRPSTVAIDDYRQFERLVRTLFQQRRKMISNAIAPLLADRPPSSTATAAAVLARASIDGTRRPETLTLIELAALARSLGQAPDRGTTAAQHE